MYSEEYLYHHGIKGMKWGVRRYRNYDGSYTQAGLKRYDKSMGEYERANERYKNAKKTGASDADITNAKLARKAAKRQVNKDYKHLKQDKLADQGKKLYANGHTITGDSQVSTMLKTIGGMTVSGAVYAHNAGLIGNKKVTQMLVAGGMASMGVGFAKQAADSYRAKRLRAYYGHTSNY